MQKRLSVLIPVVLIATAAVGWRLMASSSAGSVSAVEVGGRVEGDESAIASKTSGRILEVRVREGDAVQAGDTIARLDDSQIRSREDQARLAVAVAEAREQAARRQIAIFEDHNAVD